MVVSFSVCSHVSKCAFRSIADPGLQATASAADPSKTRCIDVLIHIMSADAASGREMHSRLEDLEAGDLGSAGQRPGVGWPRSVKVIARGCRHGWLAAAGLAGWQLLAR